MEESKNHVGEPAELTNNRKDSKWDKQIVQIYFSNQTRIEYMSKEQKILKTIK